MPRHRNPSQDGTGRPGRFEKYRDEKTSPIRKGEVKEDKAVAELWKLWKQITLKCDINVVDGTPDEYFSSYYPIFGVVYENCLSYSADDISRLLISLPELAGEKPLQEGDFPMLFGMFTSALVNLCPDDHFTLHTNHLDNESIPLLGVRNIKNVDIHGDVCGCTAAVMRGGQITIHGNVMLDHFVGGSQYAGDVGLGMEGGTLIIRGHGGDNLGHAMVGGEIHVEGDYESIGEVIHGKIYHKGKLIVDK